MMTATQIIDEANALPVEQRACVVESLLKSLNPPESSIDQAWGKVARRRLAELESGAVKAIPGDKVFEEVFAQFRK